MCCWPRALASVLLRMPGCVMYCINFHHDIVFMRPADSTIITVCQMHRFGHGHTRTRAHTQKQWNIEQIALDGKQVGRRNFFILLLKHALRESIQHITHTCFCVHIFVNLHTCSIPIQVFNLCRCWTATQSGLWCVGLTLHGWRLNVVFYMNKGA